MTLEGMDLGDPILIVETLNGRDMVKATINHVSGSYWASNLECCSEIVYDHIDYEGWDSPTKDDIQNMAIQVVKLPTNFAQALEYNWARMTGTTEAEAT